MSEINSPSLAIAADVVSRPVKRATDISSEAVKPSPNITERISDQDQRDQNLIAENPLESLGEQLTELIGDDLENLALQIEEDEDTGRFVYKSVNRETGETVRQFPSDELLRVIRAVREATGLTVDVDA